MPKPQLVTLTTLNVRGIDRETVGRLKRGARSRELRIGEYLDRLARLHEELRAMPRLEPRVAELLARLGLQAVTS